jgi:hypothetical protein
MATGLYDKGRQAFLEGGIAWLTDTIRVVFIDAADYTADLANDEFLSDVAAGARVGTPTALGTKTSTDGVADAADTVMSAVSGDQSEAILIYQDTGVEATSRLIAYIDSGTGLPVTPNGGDITIAWSAGANRIFKL